MIYFIITIILLIFFIIYNFFIQYRFNKKYKLLSTAKFFYVKNIILLLSFVFIGLTYFGEIENEGNNNGYIFTIDISKSMLVEDIDYEGGKISRLDATKKIISDLISELSGRFSLVVFSNEGSGLLPLTSDKDIFLTFLNGISTSNLKGNGTNYMSMLESISNRIIDDGGENIVIFTDGGDDFDSVKFENVYNQLFLGEKDNYYIYGVGSEKGGKLIEGYDLFGKPNYKKVDGLDLELKLNKENINKISKIVNGKKSYVDNLSNFNNILLKDKEIISNFLYNINNKFIIAFIFFILFIFLYIFENYYITQKVGTKK